MEDPPRDGVREAITKCHIAGIKVIMVTGDQSLTAASIAHQIGIIEDLDDAPELIQKRERLATLEEAEAKSNTIIIEGGRLQAYLDRDSTMSDDNPNKNSFLRNWLMKRDVVFARTSPENKLCIVNACQSLSHIVAVTGDGVNDSPAIKKADIGIAMGKVGTDVAKDAADILLLDDNFPNILKGVKQGRVIFETLKKIIGYNLTSNVPELIPFLCLDLFQIPLPINTILILCIDVGTDIMPNIFQSYETAEKGMLKKQPRNIKTDKLCTGRLFVYAYFFNGIIECMGCLLAYFVVMSDYGFRPVNLFFFAFDEGIRPAEQDIYNYYDPQFNGNSRAFIQDNYELMGIYGDAKEIYFESKVEKPDWDGDAMAAVDLRLFYPHLPKSFFGQCKHESRGQNYDEYVCYRIEALRHAQGAYFLAVVTMQIANAFNWRTKFSSIFNHKMDNHKLHLAFLFEYGLVMLIIFCPGLNTAFGTRPLRAEHFFPCLGMFIIFFFVAETFKFLMRHSKKPDGTPGFFKEYFNY
jgi:sodium/potassium-transporting ATPase subunit alpha